MHTININWSGPILWNELSLLCGPTDYGVYQVYGPGLIYRRVELLYIGVACKQTFGVRIPQHWQFNTSDASQVSIYVGRLMGVKTPENDVWSRDILLAEALLIYTHYPPYNRQKDGIESHAEFPALRVLNWGMYRDLQPEVSGERQAKMTAMVPYGSETYESE